MSDCVITLSNGRKMGYAEYGRVDGAPIFYIHGTPSSRIHPYLSALDTMLQNPNLPGVKVIALERPGYGLSEAASNYSLSDWVDDVDEITDQLHIEKFALVGNSGGGPFTLAIATKLSHKVTKAAIIAGMGPIGDVPDLFEKLPDEEKQAALAAMHAPEKLTTMIAQVHENPRAYLDGILQTLSEAEHSKLPLEMIDVYAQMLHEATILPDGMITDYKIMSRPWNLTLEEIHPPVKFWHSENDMTVPISHSEYLVSKIPNASLDRLQGPSHFTTMLAAIKDILGFLLTSQESIKK